MLNHSPVWKLKLISSFVLFLFLNCGPEKSFVFSFSVCQKQKQNKTKNFCWIFLGERPMRRMLYEARGLWLLLYAVYKKVLLASQNTSRAHRTREDFLKFLEKHLTLGLALGPCQCCCSGWFSTSHSLSHHTVTALECFPFPQGSALGGEGRGAVSMQTSASLEGPAQESLENLAASPHA